MGSKPVTSRWHDKASPTYSYSLILRYAHSSVHISRLIGPACHIFKINSPASSSHAQNVRRLIRHLSFNISFSKTFYPVWVWAAECGNSWSSGVHLNFSTLSPRAAYRSQPSTMYWESCAPRALVLVSCSRVNKFIAIFSGDPYRSEWAPISSGLRTTLRVLAGLCVRIAAWREIDGKMASTWGSIPLLTRQRFRSEQTCGTFGSIWSCLVKEMCVEEETGRLCIE